MRSTMFLALILVVFAANILAAQAPPESGVVAIGEGAPGLPPLAPRAGMVTMHVENMDVPPVKGSPFCATVTTDHTQAFADGNRIHSSDSSTLCRDAQGRTRREAGLNLLGAGAQSPGGKIVTILDPVAGFRYVLDSENKVAHRTAISSSPHPAGAGIKVTGPGGLPPKGDVIFFQHVAGPGPNVGTQENIFFKRAGQAADEPTPATENLGDQTIDGIHATGTRMTTTIPAGKMGNEQPIMVTSERWYSPELKATVLTKHSDPWAGELKTQFTNVNTSEPDSSLFLVPGDYKIMDEKAGPFVIQKPGVLAPPPQ
jgi:hypothetical protein